MSPEGHAIDELEPETIRARRAWPAGFAYSSPAPSSLSGSDCTSFTRLLVGFFALAPIRTTIAAVGVLPATVPALWAAARMLHRARYPHRLELGRDAVRLVRGGLSGESVEAHIPYRNIARVTPAKGRTSRLAVALHDPGDADMLIATAEGRHRLSVGVSYRFPDGWESPTLRRRSG